MAFSNTRVYNAVKALYEARNVGRVVNQSTYNIIQDIAQAVLDELESHIKVAANVTVTGTVTIPAGGGGGVVNLDNGKTSVRGNLEQV